MVNGIQLTSIFFVMQLEDGSVVGIFYLFFKFPTTFATSFEFNIK